MVTGIQLSWTELQSVIEKHGIKRVEPHGEKFDYNLHQAMFEVPTTDQPSGVVLEVVQHGYILHDRLLRPAMVGVSKGGPKSAVTEDNPPTVEPAKEKVANDGSSAYEKQSEAANQTADINSGQLDEKL